MTWNVLRACIGCVALSCVLHADPLWSGTYNGPYNSYDEVYAIGVDDSGNVIVSGFSELSANDAEFVTIKYKPSGDTAWLRHFNPGSGCDGGTALAVDRSGNVIITGYLGSSTSQYGEWQTIKYSPTGDSLWTTTRDFGNRDRPTQVAVDSAGNSYVTGEAGSLNYLDFVAVKYDPNGTEAWAFNYDGGDNDGANAIAVARDGNVYLTGYTIRSGSYGDLLTCKVSPTGESLWATVYVGPGGKSDMGRFITVDGSGNVLVGGVSNDSAGRSHYVTIKYAPNGDTLWTRRYVGAGNQDDQIAGLALDQAGNVYVTGGSYVDQNHYNYATIKYSPDGSERWVVLYAGLTGRATAQGIALDAEANVYVTGSSADSTGGWDVVTVKYDSAGNQRWVERYDRPSRFDEGYVLALSRQGNVFVGGRTDDDSTGIDYLTLAYGSAGAVKATPSAEVRTTNRGPTIVRGILNLQSATCNLQPEVALLDAAGRKVLDLVPGPNDISRLAPGVYFMRPASGVMRSASGVERMTKVIINH
ncbi:hypothetical protein FJY68_01855 [candidate division WOR-3 bacterium]|uniref:T9SS type A sorting domain-containing protein n=1 Tax=candidate division WOR-3 bacterium TaxID=2052148 RepID=A0A937XGC2_UNCW3|nr:hypothetical protein [candidate division WOR-3 bacterium]